MVRLLLVAGAITIVGYLVFGYRSDMNDIHNRFFGKNRDRLGGLRDPKPSTKTQRAWARVLRVALSLILVYVFVLCCFFFAWPALS